MAALGRFAAAAISVCCVVFVGAVVVEIAKATDHATAANFLNHQLIFTIGYISFPLAHWVWR